MTVGCQTGYCVIEDKCSNLVIHLFPFFYSFPGMGNPRPLFRGRGFSQLLFRFMSTPSRVGQLHPLRPGP